MTKKICLITSIYDPYTRGGIETVVNNIVQGFVKANYQTIVITLCPFKNIKSLWPQKTQENGAIIYRFYSFNLFSFLNINNYKNRPILRFFWHTFDVFNLHGYLMTRLILKREHPAAVMTHAIKGISYLVPLAIKHAKIKNILTVHDVQLSNPTGQILKNQENSWQNTFILTKLYEKINRWIFQSPEIVISSSNFLLNFYTARGFFKNSKKIVLTNPVQIKIMTPVINDNQKNFTFLFLGQIEEHKGILLLINVFKQLIKEIADPQNIFLKIVGTGSKMEAAQKLAKACPQINFLGYIPNQEITKIFHNINATIVSSLCYENSPTVIFESLSNGIPVLAARIGGIEFIKDNYNGFTFEAGDEADLLKIMKFCLENKKQLANMSANCQESIKDIGVENYVKKLEKFI